MLYSRKQTNDVRYDNIEYDDIVIVSEADSILYSMVISTFDLFI
jgi:hypothetical protein